MNIDTILCHVRPEPVASTSDTLYHSINSNCNNNTLEQTFTVPEDEWNHRWSETWIRLHRLQTSGRILRLSIEHYWFSNIFQTISSKKHYIAGKVTAGNGIWSFWCELQYKIRYTQWLTLIHASTLSSCVC